MLALPIFPGSHPPSIVGADELNFCVRDGNRWTLIAINTNYIRFWSTRSSVSRQLLYYTALPSFVKRYLPAPRATSRSAGDPYRIRTDVNGVRGHCLNHLTNGPFPCVSYLQRRFQRLNSGPPSRTRTGDPLIKSQLLYQLS